MKKITFFILIGLVSIQAYANSFGGVNQLSCSNVTNGDYIFSKNGTTMTKSQRTAGNNYWRICKGFYKEIENAHKRCKSISENLRINYSSTWSNTDWSNNIRVERRECIKKINEVMAIHNNL